MLGLITVVLALVCLKQRRTIKKLRKDGRASDMKLSCLGHTLWFLNNGLLSYIEQSPTVKKARSRVADALTQSSWGK